MTALAQSWTSLGLGLTFDPCGPFYRHSSPQYRNGLDAARQTSRASGYCGSYSEIHRQAKNGGPWEPFPNLSALPTGRHRATWNGGVGRTACYRAPKQQHTRQSPTPHGLASTTLRFRAIQRLVLLLPGERADDTMLPDRRSKRRTRATRRKPMLTGQKRIERPPRSQTRTAASVC